MKITGFETTKILNSKGDFAIQVGVRTKKGFFKASAPKGTSTGKYEFPEFIGGINNSLKKMKLIQNKIKQMKFENLDDVLSFETETKQYGGGVCLPITYSLMKALAAEKNIGVWKLFTNKKRMPALVSKMLGGGAHQEGGPEFQEFLAISESKKIINSINKNLRAFENINKILKPIGRDLEGGWAADISNERAFRVLKKAFKGKIGCDFAASDFYKNGKYVYARRKLSEKEQIKYMVSLGKKYNIFYLEDPFHEDDFEGFAELTEKIGKNSLVVGDDLFATNPERLKKGVDVGACNACIVKPNQIGSVSETIEFVGEAKKRKILPVMSHRSGETNDDIISDLAVGLEIPMFKISISGGERISKINRLIEIEGE